MLNLPQLRNFGRASVEAFPAHLDHDGLASHTGPSRRVRTGEEARILSIGDDSILLYSRRLILETAGYSVESTRGDLAAVEQILLRRFDLVLLCHTIAEELVRHIVEASMRIAPQTPLLQISPLDTPFGKEAHPALISADPTTLLSAVAAQLAGQRDLNRSRLGATR